MGTSPRWGKAVEGAVRDRGLEVAVDRGIAVLTTYLASYIEMGGGGGGGAA